MESVPEVPAPEPPIDPAVYPELGDRYRSLTIDSIVIITLMFAAAYLFEAWPSAPEDARKWAFVLIWAGYEPIATAFGSTVGNYVMKIRVRRVGNESRRINILQAYVRYVVKLPLGWLSFLTMGGNAKRRAIHDLASGAVMVRASHGSGHPFPKSALGPTPSNMPSV
jgi:uncharacterized RDD family membrane protein YckC